jgi:hypothetical protein
MLRDVLADQRTLDAEETTRVRIAMSLLSNALLLGGHLEEARSLIEQSEALHERLTGGVNDEGIAQASRHSLVCALLGDGAGALHHLARVDALAVASGEAEAVAIERFPLRVLALATAGRHAEALTHAEAMQPHLESLTRTVRVRLQRARALALRGTGKPERGRDAADEALALAAAGACNGLEHGLTFAESARCHLALGAPALAARQWHAALRTWNAAQIDGPELRQQHAELADLQEAH